LRVFQRRRGAAGPGWFADRIAGMPRRPAEPAADDRTPQARLSEAALHGVVGYQLAQASIVTTQVFDAAVGRASHVRPVEYTMLALIHANPGVTARQLARGLAVTPPNIAVWIERLQSRGLVLRSRSETDARLQHIRVSAAGAKLVREATKRLLEGEAAALASLSAAERAMLVELLHKVALARKRASTN
jgi:DNA-binding MarR family transcriptional regulator